MKKIVSFIFTLGLLFSSYCVDGQEFSTAGFYEIKNSGREVFNVNPAWRFIKGDVNDGYKIDFDDSKWEVVSLPHGLELLPEDASGGANYQGIAWYRKNIKVDSKLKGDKLFLHFEGIMGKSKVWINGELVKENFDGYLPVIIDVTDVVDFSDKGNVVAVMTDNSDDPLVPPGKPQRNLDFVYFGGIYRDCFLISHNKVHITDSNYENIVAGGGVFTYFKDVSKNGATMGVNVHLRNDSDKSIKGVVKYTLKNSDGKSVAVSDKKYSLASNRALDIKNIMTLTNPKLWGIENPYLYDLEITVTDSKGAIIDGFSQKVGVREVEFKEKDGLYINGEKCTEKIMGVNRHQDFALIGNALPNSLHIRDAIKLREAGIRIIRLAHYPHDPAFLDACDRYGIFVILPIAGWQFWNDNPLFAERVYSHIRNMVRRDRNHPSVFIWEPVLNETHYPNEFAAKSKACTDEEYPFSLSLTASDRTAIGSELYPVIFSHPNGIEDGENAVVDSTKLTYTREFGDNVDDWNSHNSPSRTHRSWGEIPMLIQANHYAHPDYIYSCLETIYSSNDFHLGGTLWHGFDHQRGYHPQPFYGGIMDAYRQAKSSYYMFMSQRPVQSNEALAVKTGPMVYVAHEMTPFSPSDVTVYSNCEEVRLTVYKNGKVYTYNRSSSPLKMPSPIIVFKDAFDFMELKELSRANKHDEIYMLAEGIIDGKVVYTYKAEPSVRPTKIRLSVDDCGVGVTADGSDIVVVVAEITDDKGVVKRLNNCDVKFNVSGSGRLLGDDIVRANWGSAPVLVQSSDKAGVIKVTAEIITSGIHVIAPDEIEITTKPKTDKYIYDTELFNISYQQSVIKDVSTPQSSDEVESLKKELNALKKQIANSELKEVEQQQTAFGEGTSTL